MRSMEAPRRTYRQGKHLDVSCPPPSEWDYDDRGRPTWIPLRRSGAWHRLIDSGRVIVELPRLADRHESHHGYGRPRLTDTRPDLDELVWRHDLLGDGFRTIATALHHAGQDPRTTIRYRVRAGQRSLAASGVIPWAAFTDGALPHNWWSDEDLEATVLRWSLETLQPATSVAAVIRPPEPISRRLLSSKGLSTWLKRARPM